MGRRKRGIAGPCGCGLRFTSVGVTADKRMERDGE